MLCAIINFPAPSSSKRLAKKLYKLILALCLIWGSNFKSLNFSPSHLKHVKSPTCNVKNQNVSGLQRKMLVSPSHKVSHQLGLSP